MGWRAQTTSVSQLRREADPRTEMMISWAVESMAGKSWMSVSIALCLRWLASCVCRMLVPQLGLDLLEDKVDRCITVLASEADVSFTIDRDSNYGVTLRCIGILGKLDEVN